MMCVISLNTRTNVDGAENVALVCYEKVLIRLYLQAPLRCMGLQSLGLMKRV